MVHATNHPDGCLLMNDNICKRWDDLTKIQSGNQLMLWSENPENEIIDMNVISDEICEHIKRYRGYTDLKTVLCEFIMQTGVRCSVSEINNELKKLEESGKILVQRNPALTKTQKPSQFWSFANGQSVAVRGAL